MKMFYISFHDTIRWARVRMWVFAETFEAACEIIQCEPGYSPKSYSSLSDRVFFLEREITVEPGIMDLEG